MRLKQQNCHPKGDSLVTGRLVAKDYALTPSSSRSCCAVVKAQLLRAKSESGSFESCCVLGLDLGTFGSI